MTSMTQDLIFFFQFLRLFLYSWLLFNYNHIIQILIARIGLENNFIGSLINFQRKAYCVIDFDTF